MDAEQALNDNKTFQVVWSVLRALRSHDDRFDLEINSLDLNRKRTKRIKIIDGCDRNGNGNGDDKGDDEELDRATQRTLNFIYEIPAGAIYAKVVEKCGDRKYWPQWAEDVADIAERIRVRVTGLLQDPERITLNQQFQSFLSDLRLALNRELQETDVVAMVAQHLVTGPVFQALFKDYDFVGRNPVSRALSRLGGTAGERGVGERDQGAGAILRRVYGAGHRHWTTQTPVKRCCWSCTNAFSAWP